MQQDHICWEKLVWRHLVYIASLYVYGLKRVPFGRSTVMEVDFIAVSILSEDPPFPENEKLK
jgi:hypothetical protein